MRRYIIAFGILFLSVSTLICLVPASASASFPDSCKGSFLGMKVWYEYLDGGPKGNPGEPGYDPCALIGPKTAGDDLDWEKAVPRILLVTVEDLLRIAGLVAVAFTISGGFRYILSQGEPEATKKAKGTIVGASVGLVIAVFAATIVGFIGNILWK